MLINGVTIDLMIQFYIVGLFSLIIVCLYALIQSKANKLYTFTIIPLALIIASMTWQGIKLLQGMPVYGLPMETQVQVMFVHDSKPWIYVLLNSENGPKFYKIDWTEENKKKMKDLQKKIGSSSGDGKFKEGNPGESKSFFFTPMMNMSDHQGKEPEQERSSEVNSEVTFENNVITGSGPGNTTNPDRPSLEVDNDDNETSFTRGDGVTIPWSTQLLFPEHKETFIGPLNRGEE
jgi:hypothetical protein